MALTAQTCAHHPERLGFALCMACRRVVCQECATTWKGVNHCRPCLAELRASAERRTPVLSWVLFGALSLVLFLLCGRAMVWAGMVLEKYF
jgi:hypothetical protein